LVIKSNVAYIFDGFVDCRQQKPVNDLDGKLALLTALDLLRRLIFP
jgi:hypothetical protein